MTFETFTPVHMACSIYDGNTYEQFYTGTPTPPGGTVVLSTYHAYRGLCWFDGEAVAAALSGKRAVSIAVSCRSAGNSRESREPCALQLYRTTLTYDAEKAGYNSGDTARPDAGMTFDDPVNEYFAEAARTEPLAWGGALENSVFMTGDAASRMGEALARGCALGTWQLRSGTVFSAGTPPFCVRYLNDISVTIGMEPLSRDVISPGTFRPARSKATADGTAEAFFSGTLQQSDENPVTGYLLSFRDRTEDEWGEWSGAETVSLTDTEGTLSLAAPPAGTERTWRIAAVSAGNTGEWREMSGTVTGIPAPGAPRASVKMQGCAAIVDAVISPASYDAGGCRYLLIDGQIAGMTGPSEEETRIRCRHLCDICDVSIAVSVKDEYGGESPAVLLPVTPSRCFDRTAFCFGGVCSEDMGIRLLQSPDTSFAPRALSVLRAAGSSESTVLWEENSVFLPAESELLLYLPPDADRETAGAALQGEGMLRLGAEPAWQRRAVILSVSEEGVYSDGGRKMKARLLLSPFRLRAEEAALPVTRGEMLIHCGGAAPALPVIELNCTGDVKLTVNDDTLLIGGAGGHVTVDCEKKTVTGEDGTVYETSGDFPCLAPGVNRLTIGGSVTDGSILRRERYL